MIEDRSLKINWILGRATLSGGVKSNRLIAEAMVRRGHIVNIIYVSLPRPSPPIWRIRTFFKCLIGRLNTPGKPHHHLITSAANLMPLNQRPIRQESVPDADFTFATWWETAHWIRDWPKSKGIKAYFIRGHELHGGEPSLVKETYQFPYKKFVIATWLKTLMAEEYGDNHATLVPNGVDWDQFRYIPREKNAIPTIGLLFGIVKLKGASTAFRAIKLVQAKTPELRVVSFGAHRIPADYDLPDNFEYHYQPEQNEIPSIYRSVDCWLLPSTTEGFGMPGLEAAACGCPVVSTRCGGPEDYVVEGENGYLVNVGDEVDMAEKLLKVVRSTRSEWKAMSQRSAEIAKQFDWDKSAEILEKELYVQLAKSGPGS